MERNDASKLEAVRLETRTLCKSLVQVFKQWYQLSRELRHIPTVLLVVGIATVYGMQEVQAPYDTLECSAVSCICPNELNKTGAEL